MTEQEYIDATNLAKIRAAKVIIYDALFMNHKDAKLQTAVLTSLRVLESKLEKIVNPEPGERFDPPTRPEHD